MAPDSYSSLATRRMLELEGAKLASFGRRSFAFGVDFLVAIAASAGIIIAGAAGAERLGLLPLDTNLHLQFNFSNWYSVISVVLYFGLITYIGKGQTPGKWIVGIRVVSTLHTNLTLWHSLERALGYAALALELGFGFLQYFIADNRQTTHDRIAGTIVVTVPKRSKTGG